MEVIVLSEDSKNKIKEYKKFTLSFPILTTDIGLNIMTRMDIIIKNGQVNNFKEYVQYTLKLQKQNEYEMKNYFYQEYEKSLVSTVRNKKLNLYVSYDILSYLLIPEYISLESMRHIFQSYVFRNKKDLDINYYKLKL
jgi:hypothetical protein